MTRIHFSWRDRVSSRHLPTAVSLHGHTSFSRESLSFIPAYFRTVPLLGPLARLLGEHSTATHDANSTQIWWMPPLPPREVFRIEREQIEGRLGRRPLISITDHDEIAACRMIHLLHGADAGPISLEWTVPLEPSFVHLGVHNLAAARAAEMFDELRAFTANPRPPRLPELLSWLSEDPATLVVLNHPMWDEAHVGSAHGEMVRKLVAQNRTRIHAIELNGLRPWRENLAALELARQMGIPAVSGGDRHGTEPSACLNLTKAETFSEFAHEIRESRRSEVLFLERYADSHRIRQFEAVWDLVRDYPEYPDRVRWTDRTFIRDHSGVSRSMSSIWGDDEPAAARLGFAALRLFSHKRLRPALRFAIARGHQEPAL